MARSPGGRLPTAPLPIPERHARPLSAEHEIPVTETYRHRKIVGFLQVRNEVDSGHLHRFLAINSTLFDHIYAYDDASDDGTPDLLEERGATVIRGSNRQFGREQFNRRMLLEKIVGEIEVGDFILWLDADEIVYAARDEIEKICDYLDSQGYDGATLPHINLWRSRDYFRTDDGFDALRPVRLWRNNGQLRFLPKTGLHLPMHPSGMGPIAYLESPAVVHFGFASDKLILGKYATYFEHWQRGFRLINESGRSLSELASRKGSLGSRFAQLHSRTDSSPPEERTAADWFLAGERARSAHRCDTGPLLTVVCLIYASTEWAEFAYAEILRGIRDLPRGAAEILFVANDATPDVLEFLVSNRIPHISVKTRRREDEWFINGVYRAYNAGAESARGRYVLFVNSDMGYSAGAIGSLIARASSDHLVASRLVEQGVMESGKHGIEKSFGSSPRRFRRRDFFRYSQSISENREEAGGLFMPLLVPREVFLRLGGYPEGNVRPESLAAYVEADQPAQIAERGDACIPGDAAFIARAAHHGIEHVTAFDSVVYHFQAGEMRSAGRKRIARRSGIMITNDRIVGINGEKVLWSLLADRLRSRGYTVNAVSAGRRFSILSYWNTVRKARRAHPPRVLFANATYVLPQFTPSRYIVLRQDLPAQRWLRALQAWVIRRSDHVVANDAAFVAEMRSNATWLPLPLSPEWDGFSGPKSLTPQRPTGVIVGAFNETKGWDQARSIVLSREDIDWILVSKYADDAHGLQADVGPNWVVRRQLSQTELRSILQSATFTFVNSPYETQCLAALESCACDTPVLIRPTGLIGSVSPKRQDLFGVVTDDPVAGLDELLGRLASTDPPMPKQALKDLGLDPETAWARWMDFFDNQIVESFLTDTELPPVQSFIDRAFNYGMLRMRQFYRNARRSAARALSRT